MKTEELLAVGLAVLLLAHLSLVADVLYLRDGQSVDGTYLGGTARLVRFRVGGIIKTYQVSEVQEIQFTADASAAPGPAPAGASESAGRPSSARPVLSEAPRPPVTRRVAVRDEYMIPTGTVLRVRTNELIDSDRARVGDTFSASLDQDVAVNGELLAERASPARLRIIEVEEAGEFKGRTLLVIDLAEIAVAGSSYRLSATQVEQRGESQGKRTGALVGGGAALGAIIGAIAGGGKGAAIGAAVGGASGAGVQVLTKGEKLKIPAETVLEFSLQQDLLLRR